MRVLVWHVHGGWLNSFVRGEHDYLIPRLPVGGEWGLGLAGRDWPRATEVPVEELVNTEVDVVVLQRAEEIELVHRWLGRTPGKDLPAIYVEHNTPPMAVREARHPLADHPELLLAHVTHFNDLVWDCGTTPTVVIEHGVPDPGHRYTGELPHAGVVVNEPIRRGRVAGTDLLPRFAAAAPLDVFGMGLDGLGEHLGLGPDRLTACGDLTTADLHTQLARRRVYLHPYRWTSLGLAMLEAMHLGMPVLALAVTEAPRAVPPTAGVLSTRVEDLVEALHTLTADPALARELGAGAREHVLAHHGLTAFVDHWDRILTEVTR
ncbi:glycosyltransferase [Crossiella sp. CA-258035]|uniref:glycosyltransferase n=1 Tax=Crossiella sp. CA-258035 TaxID=2981138 RepID=UPI0024BBF62E|nr:glycosyltransferase [Crossiella sp. CA-258035]WHT15934.1 glycosyltransferase [Crossiella sp. CA-258035]